MHSHTPADAHVIAANRRQILFAAPVGLLHAAGREGREFGLRHRLSREWPNVEMYVQPV